MDMKLREVVESIKKEIGVDEAGRPLDIAKATERLMDIDSIDGVDVYYEDIARALHSPEGFNLSVDETAKELGNAPDLSVHEVAQALYSEGGLNLSVEEVAYALYEAIKAAKERKEHIMKLVAEKKCHF